MSTFQQMFPEVKVPDPIMPGRPQHSTRHATLRRQQLSDIAVAFGLNVNPDATKDELLVAIAAAEQSGALRKPPLDPHRLTKASKNADEWQMYLANGGQLPPFEEPDEGKKLDPDSFRGLQERMKARGLSSFGKGIAEMKAALAEVGG